MYKKKSLMQLSRAALASLSLSMASVLATPQPELGTVYNPAEQYKVAIQLLESKNTKTDFAMGLKWLKLAAAQQYPQALNQLGFYHEYGIDEIHQDLAEAAKYYEQAAKQGLQEAQLNLSVLLLREDTPLRDQTRGMTWLRAAADSGSVPAQYGLAMLLAKQPATAADAMQWLTKAAQNGHKTSQYTLGVYYLKGTLVPADSQQSFNWFLKAAEQGDAAAQFNAALMCEQGEGVKVDMQRAIHWYEQAAAQNEPGALFNLGSKHLFGTDGVKANVEHGLELIKRAAEEGNPAAQTLIGNLLSTGKYLGVDYSKAFQLYLAAAESGYPEAQYQLSLMFARGQGVQKSNEKSVQWIQKAAQSNHALAQYGLGAYFANGVGIEKNLIEAAYWLSLAAAQGQQHAIESRNSVLELLSGEELATLNKRIKLSTTPLRDNL